MSEKARVYFSNAEMITAVALQFLSNHMVEEYKRTLQLIASRSAFYALVGNENPTHTAYALAERHDASYALAVVQALENLVLNSGSDGEIPWL